eukprot:scaffold17526_cov64-Phaeocystis_antarctica.AAC.5
MPMRMTQARTRSSLTVRAKLWRRGWWSATPSCARSSLRRLTSLNSPAASRRDARAIARARPGSRRGKRRAAAGARRRAANRF